MKTSNNFILTLLLLLANHLNAQKDEDLIKQSIEMYFDGWMTGDTMKIGKVMHSTCNLKNIKDNEVVVIDRKNYLSRFKLRPRLENAVGRIISINVTGKIASAKCEIEIPGRTFTDYFNMMKLNEFWYIVDKISVSKTKSKLNDKLDSYISDVLKAYDIPGIALAIIKKDTILHENYYGQSNIEMAVPVSDKTLFPLFSTTKIMSTIAAYQLVEQNKLSLEQNISDFLNDLPKDWKKVKVKHLLAHASGLPDIVNYSSDNEEVAKKKVYRNAIKCPVDQQFDYNQTNFWLLNRIVQKLTNKTLSEFVIENQFQDVGQNVQFEGNNLSTIQNLSYGYIKDANTNRLLKRNWNFPIYQYGAAGLNMTLKSFMEWDRKFDNGTFISNQVKQQLFRPYNYKVNRDFTHGLDLINSNGEISYGFSGGVSTAYRKFKDKDLTIILLANGMFIPTDKLKGINDVVNTIALLVNEK